MHCFVLLFVDLVLIAISTIAAFVLCGGDAPSAANFDTAVYCATTLAVALPVLLALRLNRTVWRFTSLDDATLIALAAASIATLATLLNSSFHRAVGTPGTFLVLHGLLMLCALGSARLTMRARHDMRRRARKSRGPVGACENVLVVGLNPLANLFLHCVTENHNGSLNVVGILSEAERHRGRWLRSRKILGTPDAIPETLHDLAVHGVFVDRIVIASPISELSEKARTSLLELEKAGKVRVDHLPTQYGLHLAAGDTSESEVQENIDADLPRRPYLRWKRFIDAVIASICAVCFAPLMSIIFVVVLFDVGAPAIFWQQRPGARGRPIRVLKFRTMRPARDRDGRYLSDAERLSRIGRFLRRLRLDELPQVFNVLLGDMSLVGPRPLLPIDQPSTPSARLQLRPGLTGWAQIKGGRHLSIEDKAALDLWYIKNASFTLDMVILAQTVRMVLFGERVDRDAIHQAWQTLRSDQTILLRRDEPEHNPA